MRHFALDKVADEKLKARSSLNLWDNGNVSKDGKNVDDHGASCLGALAGVDGRVVPRPAVESDCVSGSKGSSARHEQARRRSEDGTEASAGRGVDEGGSNWRTLCAKQRNCRWSE